MIKEVLLTFDLEKNISTENFGFEFNHEFVSITFLELATCLPVVPIR